MYQGFVRAGKQPGRTRQKHGYKMIQAPVKGLTTAKPIGTPAPGYARVIENAFPRQQGVRVRGGIARHALTGTKAVKSFLTYRSGTNKKMFAATITSIYDVTAPVDVNVAPTASVTGMTSGDWIGVNYSNVGNGQILLAVNGSDVHRVYDGTSWAANVPAITFPAGFTSLTTADLSFVMMYGSRLWFIQKNSMNVWYLPVDVIGGELARFGLGGLFSEGGSLLFLGTWSTNTGDGLDQQIVFGTDQGQNAVFRGIDPSSPTGFSKVGVYTLTEPLGKYCTMYRGGELMIATRAGIVPLSAAVNKDPGMLSISDVTWEVNDDWREAVAANPNSSWKFAAWPERGMAIASPSAEITEGAADVIGEPTASFAVNLETTKFGKYIGWDIQAAVHFDGQVYIGSANGRVYAIESGGNDDGESYLYRVATWPDHIDSGRGYKTFLQERTAFTYSEPFNARVTVSTNYDLKWPAILDAAQDRVDGTRWDASTALYDDANTLWDNGAEKRVLALWRSVGRSGYVGSVLVQALINNVNTPDFEWLSTELTLEAGSTVI